MQFYAKARAHFFESLTELTQLLINPYRFFFVVLVQPICVLILFTSFLNGFLTVPHFPAEQLTRKIIVYGLAIIGIVISMIAKYSMLTIKKHKNPPTIFSALLTNIVVLLLRVIVLFTLIKIFNIQIYDKLYFPMFPILLVQT